MITESEELFFNSLWNELGEQNSFIELLRMSDGSISVQYKSYPIGKIRLQGKKHWMQILKSLYNNTTIQGNVSLFIEHIPEWMKYIQKYCK